MDAHRPWRGPARLGLALLLGLAALAGPRPAGAATLYVTNTKSGSISVARSAAT
jgi:hypothetical protein